MVDKRYLIQTFKVEDGIVKFYNGFGKYVKKATYQCTPQMVTEWAEKHIAEIHKDYTDFYSRVADDKALGLFDPPLEDKYEDNAYEL